jgi:hypothetical protein
MEKISSYNIIQSFDETGCLLFWIMPLVEEEKKNSCLLELDPDWMRNSRSVQCNMSKEQSKNKIIIMWSWIVRVSLSRT